MSYFSVFSYYKKYKNFCKSLCVNMFSFPVDAYTWYHMTIIINCTMLVDTVTTCRIYWEFFCLQSLMIFTATLCNAILLLFTFCEVLYCFWKLVIIVWFGPAKIFWELSGQLGLGNKRWVHYDWFSKTLYIYYWRFKGWGW